MALTDKQIEIIDHESGNILVSASAGSGKTHTMIERIKRLVIQKGVQLKNILAVTFTEASAADMKGKLKKALIEVINGKVEGFTEEQKNVCRKQLVEIPTADISTMHSFCGRIIRAYFFVVGLSPDFAVLDKAEADVLRIKSVEKTFKEFYDKGEEWFIKLVDQYAQGRMDTKFKELILDAYNFSDSEADPEQFIEKYQDIYTEDGLNALLKHYKEMFDARVKTYLDDVYIALQVFKNEELEKGCGLAKDLIIEMESALKEPDVYALKKHKVFDTRLSMENKISEGAKECKAIMSKAKSGFNDLLTRVNKSTAENIEQERIKFDKLKEHTQGFVRVLNRFRDIYEQEKRDENVLDFNNLEHFTLKILENEQVREDVKKKYSYIFIDEYQDTNGVQEEIISKIANDNVFMVGDVKQSIYGFRGCRPDFFIEKDNTMEKNGQKVVRLNHNFRSAQKVLDMVNSVFDFCMTKEVYGESYKEKARLVTGGLYPQEACGRAELHHLIKQSGEKKAPEIARIYDVIKEQPKEEESEIQTLSALISNIIMEERGKTFYDMKDKKFRPVEFGDIAVLTRKRQGKYVNELVSGLIANGIPVSSDVNENICDYPEIQVMINALKLIDCYLQDLPLVSTLKSPIGGFTEEDLFEVVRYYDDNVENAYGGFSDAYRFYINKAQTPLKERLLAFENYFAKIRLYADFAGAHGALMRLVNDSDIEANLYAKPLGEKMVDRLKKFISASIVNGKTLTVREFLLRVSTCPEAFGLSPFDEENTVTVTTIHSSKGLEYPVVITCGLEEPFTKKDDSKEIMHSRKYAFATRYYDEKNRTIEETLLRGVIREENYVERMREEMRLFYVATTRATYSLHLAFWSKDDMRRAEFVGAERYLDFIPSVVNKTEHDNEYLETRRKKEEVKDVIIVKPDENVLAKMRKDFEYEYPFKEDCALSLKASVSQVSKEDLKEGFAPVYVISEDKSNTKESGTIAHKVLEYYDFTSARALTEQVNEMLSNGIVTQEELSQIDLSRLENAISNEVFNDLKGKELYREKSFLVNVPANMVFDTSSETDVLIQGIIDLLVIDGEEAKIIDYKYSVLSKENIKEKYKKQLDLYAYAVEKGLNKKVVSKTLVNVFKGEVINLD